MNLFITIALLNTLVPVRSIDQGDWDGKLNASEDLNERKVHAQHLRRKAEAWAAEDILSKEQCAAKRQASQLLGIAGPDKDVCPVDGTDGAEGSLGEVVELIQYGRWCGPGNGGKKLNDPPPKDAVDKVCMLHDLCYDSNYWFSCRCDQQLKDDMPAAIAATGGSLAEVAGTALQAYYSMTFCYCREPLWLPGFGGECLGLPNVGVATTLVIDLITKGVAGAIVKAWKEAGGILEDAFKYLKCKYTCKYSSSRQRNIKKKAKRVEAAARANNNSTWLKEVVCLSKYLDRKKNRVCARCMIGTKVVDEIRSTSRVMTQLVSNNGLWRHDNGCSSLEASTSEACAHALHRECSHILPSGQRESAFGVPHQLASDTIIHSCTAAISTHLVKRKDLNAMFQAPHTDCGGATGEYCTSKAHQYCMNHHNPTTQDPTTAGLIVEERSASKNPQDNDLMIVCFPLAVWEPVPMTTMMAMHSHCNSIYHTASIYCHAAAANWCSARGYKAGVVLQADGSKNLAYVGCWHPLLYPVGSPLGVDPSLQC